MKQITKHKIRALVAYAMIIAAILSVLLTDATKYLGWVLILIATLLVSVLWFLYEEYKVKRLEAQRDSKGRKWTRGG